MVLVELHVTGKRACSGKLTPAEPPPPKGLGRIELMLPLLAYMLGGGGSTVGCGGEGGAVLV